MNLQKKRVVTILLLTVPYILVTGVIIGKGISDVTYTVLRLSGLFGFLSLSLGAVLTLAKNELKSIFGQPFLTIHHVFVLSGLVLITIHPILLVLAGAPYFVFIPDTSSVSAFLANGGRLAIILIYIGFLAAVFRSILKGRWILIHRIMYLGLVLGIIHANLLGEDLVDPIIRILCNGIAVVVLLTGIIKFRYRFTHGYVRNTRR